MQRTNNVQLELLMQDNQQKLVIISRNVSGGIMKKILLLAVVLMTVMSMFAQDTPQNISERPQGRPEGRLEQGGSEDPEARIIERTNRQMIKYTEELKLTPNQIKSIRPIVKERLELIQQYRPERDSDRKTMMSAMKKMKKIIEKTDKRIYKHLTKKQIKKYKRLQKEQRENQRKQMRGQRRPPMERN